MSRIFLIGDTHISLGYPNNSDKWLKVHREYFHEFLIPLLKKEVLPGDIIVHLGDLFDNRNILPIDLFNFGMDVVVEISKIAPLHIIIGNHDLWSKSASEVNSVRPFKYIPNVFVYEKVTKIQYNNQNILFMPYFDNKNDQIKAINSNKDCTYLFCHSDLNGAKMHLTSVGHKCMNKIDVDSFSNFRKVYSGHYHIVQRAKNFTFVGSIFQMDRNDYNDQKGIFVLDTNDGSETFFENKISPIFKKICVTSESDIDKLDSLKNTKDYIDISISNSLLMSSRKFRRKLETILETGSFASVEYIDDITNDKIELENNEVYDVNLALEDSEISVQLDYSDYIKEYISNQKYDSEKFEKTLNEEFSEIVRIYNENYKKNK